MQHVKKKTDIEGDCFTGLWCNSKNLPYHTKTEEIMFFGVNYAFIGQDLCKKIIKLFVYAFYWEWKMERFIHSPSLFLFSF